MVDKSKRTHRDAAQRVREAQRFAVDLPGVGKVRIPRPEQLAYFGVLTALAVAEIVEWPVALLLGAGHLLAQNENNRVARELGEALEEA